MPPFVILALAGAGAYAGYRFFSKLVEMAATPGREEQDRARQAKASPQGNRETRDLGELEFDAASGVYKPKNKG